MHFEVSNALNKFEKDKKKLESFVEKTVATHNYKLQKVGRVITNTLLLSNKTYFLEEVNSHVKEITQLRKKISLLEAKNQVYLRQLDGSEAKQLDREARRKVQN